MTIAMCYVSPEGIVLGADSTSTYGQPGSRHYYNHAQKLFEVGEDSTLGMVSWGLGGLALTSYRTLIAKLADELAAMSGFTVPEAADKWVDIVWSAYTSGDVWVSVQRCRTLHAIQPYVTGALPAPTMRTEDQEKEFRSLRATFVAGFCLAGYTKPERNPSAYQIVLDPLQDKPAPSELSAGRPYFWGAPNMILRLFNGYDIGLKAAIVASPHWGGSDADFEDLANPFALKHPNSVPMREAIDFVYSCIYCTIKALKFSSMPQICGGPIEIAVITADRDFRWVRHKHWDTAIDEPGGQDVWY